MVQTRAKRRKSILGGFRSILTKVGRNSSKKKRNSKSKKQSPLPKQPIVSPPNSPPHSSNNSNSQYYTVLPNNATSINECASATQRHHQYDDSELPQIIQEISVPLIVSPNHRGTNSYDTNDKVVNLDLTRYAEEPTLKVEDDSSFNVAENTATANASKEKKEGVRRHKIIKEQKIFGNGVFKPLLLASDKTDDRIIIDTDVTPSVHRNQKQKQSIVRGEVYESLLTASNQIEDRVIIDADSTPFVHRNKNEKERIIVEDEVYESLLSVSNHGKDFETENRIIVDSDLTPLVPRNKKEKELKVVGSEVHDPLLCAAKNITEFETENRIIMDADMTPFVESTISFETKNRSPLKKRDNNSQNTISNISFISQQEDDDDSITFFPNNLTKSKKQQEVQCSTSVLGEDQALLESRDEKDTTKERTIYSTFQSKDPLPLSITVPDNCTESAERRESTNEEITFQSGVRVEIVHGKYQGKMGVVTKVTPKMVKVKIDGESLEPRVNKSSVKILPTAATSFVEDRESRNNTSSTKNFDECVDITVNDTTLYNEPEQQVNNNGNQNITLVPAIKTNAKEVLESNDEVIAFQSGVRVEIVHGKYQGKMGAVTKVTPKMVKVKIDGESLEPRVNKSSVKILPTVDISHLHRCTSSTIQANFAITIDSDHEYLHDDTEQKQVPSSPKRDSDNRGIRFALDQSAPAASRKAVSLHVGQRIQTKKGVYKNKCGTVQSIGPVRVRVMLDGDIKARNLDKTSVVVLPQNSKDYDKNSTVATPLQVRSPKALPLDKATTQSQKRVASSTVGTRSVGRRNSTASENETATGDPNKWRFPGSRSNSAGNKFGTRRISKVRLETKTAEDTFLSHLLGFRTLVSDIPLNKKETSEPFETVTEFNNSTYELVSAKVQADGDVGSTKYQKSKCIRLVYAEVKKNGLELLSLQDELDKIANFSELDPRKVKSRLELFQSPCYKFKNKKLGLGIKFLDRTNFCEIKECGNEGCGFISERFLEGLLGRNADAKRSIAIQVRIFIPGMGIFKGMLMRKRSISDSDTPIQLPSSMRKVGPSLHQDRLESEAVLLITQAGVHQNQTNHYVGRFLDENLKDPPESFKIKRFETDMIPRLWQSLGVQKHICIEYKKKSTQREYLKHAYVVGVADPTGSLPPGHIFVTGMGCVQEEKLFVTRSPCIKACDGRLLSNIIARPAEMEVDDWTWISTLPFGAIIFANPEEGGKPLPQYIAEGDLDGDLYFVCWNKEILSGIKADPIQQIGGGDEKSSSNKGNKGQPCGDNWLKQAQEFMVDCVSTHELSQLLGKLFSESKKAADKAEQGSFLRNKDAEAFANAFYRLLEYEKHGGTIPLPLHLHCRIPEKFRKYFSDIPTQ